ncbi:MAG: hypothetical protein U0Q10_05365 [Dermatophilaceae bacterium]
MDDAVLDRGLELIEEAGARGRDAFIAATALLAGFDHIDHGHPVRRCARPARQWTGDLAG